MFGVFGALQSSKWKDHGTLKKGKGQAGKTKQDKERLCVPESILEIKGKYKSNWVNAL